MDGQIDVRQTEKSVGETSNANSIQVSPAAAHRGASARWSLTTVLRQKGEPTRAVMSKMLHYDFVSRQPPGGGQHKH